MVKFPAVDSYFHINPFRSFHDVFENGCEQLYQEKTDLLDAFCFVDDDITKGTVFFNDQSGVWLIHSVPKFPLPDRYHYPESGHDYGQTMLCLSLSYSELGKIGTQLYYNKPNIYSSRLPTSIAAKYPILAKVVAGHYKQGAPYFSIVQLTTLRNTTFKSFAKTNQFNKDLYDGLVAPALKTNMIAETWRRGENVPLECRTTYHTNDALAIQVGSTNEFKYTKDHSKLARSTDATKPWICIGDINRMTSQYVRGGGTTCMSSFYLWKAFNVIKAANHC
ncbi:deoxyribonuclease-2 domain protein [Dictyocaulus viviparus]|uniref:Deoxyribonuclease-2 domain protein n=1 Tax=Dictyocaulus viviparus TaxID=29172 RepID=A0A0D8XGB5_DICVI|nr:deoxyribonuclease-2 domain protein [Dictyocaulus viviparus]